MATLTDLKSAIDANTAAVQAVAARVAALPGAVDPAELQAAIDAATANTAALDAIAVAPAA